MEVVRSHHVVGGLTINYGKRNGSLCSAFVVENYELPFAAASVVIVIRNG